MMGTPPWAHELIERTRRIEMKLDALLSALAEEEKTLEPVMHGLEDGQLSPDVFRSL